MNTSFRAFADPTGAMTYLVWDRPSATAVVIDPLLHRWGHYLRWAEREGCKVRMVLRTVAPDEAFLRSLDGSLGCPMASTRSGVVVRLGDRVRLLGVGGEQAVLRVRGITLQVVAVSDRVDGEVAFVEPDGGVVFCPGRLSAPGGTAGDLVPEWVLGRVPGGRICAGRSTHGVFSRLVSDELVARARAVSPLAPV